MPVHALEGEVRRRIGDVRSLIEIGLHQGPDIFGVARNLHASGRVVNPALGEGDYLTICRPCGTTARLFKISPDTAMLHCFPVSSLHYNCNGWGRRTMKKRLRSTSGL